MQTCNFAILALFTNLCLAAPVESKVYADPVNTTGIKDVPTQAICNHHSVVYNNTNKSVNIITHYVVCAQNKGCDESKWFKVKVNPNGVWQDTYQTRMNVTYRYTGNYQLTCQTYITGASENSTESYGNIRID